jgi:hypothetical protein
MPGHSPAGVSLGRHAAKARLAMTNFAKARLAMTNFAKARLNVR